MADDRLLTYPEVSEQLRVSDSTARRLARFGAIEEVRVGPKAVRVRAESVRALVEHGYAAEPRGAA